MKRFNVRAVCVTGVLSALAAVLMLVEISVPLMPGFIKLDFSELPALIAAYAYGPVWGAAVCLVKNLVHLLTAGATGGIGELANFLLGAVFVLTAGCVYRRAHTRRGAFVGASAGALAMAAASIVFNYFLIYPLYARTIMSEEAILGMYRVVDPSLTSLFPALVKFNMPFTFIRGMIDTVLCFAVYKRLAPLLKGKKVH